MSVSTMLSPESSSQNDLRREIVVVGHFGGWNCGDEAMLLGLLHQVSLLPGAFQIHVIVKDEAATAPIVHEAFGAWARDHVRFTPMRFRSVLSTVQTADVLILAGGTHFHDDYRGIRLLRHYRYLTRYILLFWFARCRGLRCAAISQGFRPVRHLLTRWMLRLFSRSCHYVSAREKASAKLLESIARPGPEVGFDLASLYFPLAENPPAGRKIGLSVTELSSSHKSGADADWTAGRIARSLCHVMDGHADVMLDILVFREGSRESDTAISEEVRGLVEARHPGRVRVVEGCHNPLVAQKHIVECAVFVGMRFHSTMLAFLAGRPQIILPYHDKLSDLADEAGIHASSIVPFSDPDMEQHLAERLDKALSHPQDFIAEMPVETARQIAAASIRHAFEELKLV